MLLLGNRDRIGKISLFLIKTHIYKRQLSKKTEITTLVKPGGVGIFCPSKFTTPSILHQADLASVNMGPGQVALSVAAYAWLSVLIQI